MYRFKLLDEFRSQRDLPLEDSFFKEKMTRAALMLLAYQDITIKEVAERIGFCTSDYFIRKFRQFYGIVPGKYKEYKTPRSRIEDRRSAFKDRRQMNSKNNIPNKEDRRTGQKDRRNGRTDRGKQHNNHPGSNQNPDMKTEMGQKVVNGNSCENCYFRKCVLNLDDWR